MYKKQGGSISRLDFLLILAESRSSLGGVVQLATRGHPSKLPTPCTLLPRHGATNIKEAYKDVVFWANGKRKDLSYWCPDCEKGLCVVPYYPVCHTDRNLKN